MNSLGRHYRDQTDTSNPSCDYENCTFFTSGLEYSDLPYPEDITLGPVSDPPPSAAPSAQQVDLSLILRMLQEQKENSEKTNAQMLQLQNKVNSLFTPTPPTTTTSAPFGTQAHPTYTSASTPSMQISSIQQPLSAVYSSTATAPNMMASAAAGLTAAMQNGLGRTSNYGYNGLTIDHLRSNPAISSASNAVLAAATRNVPPLNPLSALEKVSTMQHIGNDQVINSVDHLYRATTVNKQLRAYEFASTGQFPYKSLLKADNCNAITFAYGAFKHLHAVKSGLIRMSDDEFLARLKHLRNVFEIACGLHV